MKEITILVSGTWIKLVAGSVREAYQKFKDAMRGIGVISDPERAERGIKESFIQHGSLNRGELIRRWADLTGGDFEETLSEVCDLLERFGSKEQKPSLYTRAEMIKLILEIKQAIDGVRNAMEKHNSKESRR